MLHNWQFFSFSHCFYTCSISLFFTFIIYWENVVIFQISTTFRDEEALIALERCEALKELLQLEGFISGNKVCTLQKVVCTVIVIAFIIIIVIVSVFSGEILKNKFTLFTFLIITLNIETVMQKKLFKLRKRLPEKPRSLNIMYKNLNNYWTTLKKTARLFPCTAFLARDKFFALGTLTKK